jgi:hypothetical protein
VGVKIVLIVICLGIAGTVVLAATGSFSFYAYSTSQGSDGVTKVHCYGDCAGVEASAAVDDAAAIVATDQSPTYDRAVVALLHLLQRAGSMSKPAGAALVWRNAPPLIRTIEPEQDLLIERVRAVDVQTSPGELCRRAALRLVARYQWAVQRLELSIGRSSPRWTTVKTFIRDMRSSESSYASEARACVLAAPTDEQAQLADAVGSFSG